MTPITSRIIAAFPKNEKSYGSFVFSVQFSYAGEAVKMEPE
jgi:hypothetical protein